MPKQGLLRISVRVSLLGDRLRQRGIKRIAAMMLANPVLAYAGSGNDISDMLKSVADGAKSGTSSALGIAQFAGVIICIGTLFALKAKKNNPSITAGWLITSAVVGALLIAIPEAIKRSQSQMGLTPISVG